MSANSDKQWFYAQSRKRFGPVTVHVLAQMYAQGDLTTSSRGAMIVK